ncbi:hypothetical protein [Prevotellamassilia timonensis]|uniref:hypothetical protein n=1 Tax=Prevotellamassilia timonensis TaxID=1852370 RepID=UPI001F3CA178|nr:hypothetical protein [Prevotellamassilia timonensis]MCF2634617.1 hypothetical protein [Prevotellamassilia timonensis]
MKKIFLIIILCAIGFAIARSCGGGSTTENYTTENYKEACEQHEFQKAYSFVNELKKEMQEYQNQNGTAIKFDCGDETAQYNNLKNNYEEAEHYVVLQEATYILESQGLDGLVKISMVVKEHDAQWVYADLIDIAVAMGNEELENRLQKLAGTSVDDDSNEEE